MRLKPSGGAGTTAGPPVRRNHGLFFRHFTVNVPARTAYKRMIATAFMQYCIAQRRPLLNDSPVNERVFNGRQCPIVLVILLQSRSFHCVHHIENALVHVEILI